MKPITRIKWLIKKQLTAKETYEISQYAKELSYEKKAKEHLNSIKALGVGNTVLVLGSTTETARLGIAAKIGTILSYGPKRIKVQIKDCSRPGVWRLSYRLLRPPTEKNIKHETEMAPHSYRSIGVVNDLNKIVNRSLK